MPVNHALFFEQRIGGRNSCSIQLQPCGQDASRRQTLTSFHCAGLDLVEQFPQKADDRAAFPRGTFNENRSSIRALSIPIWMSSKASNTREYAASKGPGKSDSDTILVNGTSHRDFRRSYATACSSRVRAVFTIAPISGDLGRRRSQCSSRDRAVRRTLTLHHRAARLESAG